MLAIGLLVMVIAVVVVLVDSAIDGIWEKIEHSMILKVLFVIVCVILIFVLST